MWISAQLLLSEQILCLLRANLQRLGVSTLLVNRRCDLVWMLRGRKLQHPDRQIQDFCCQTWCKWRTFCLCCVGKENEILDIKALCHWSSVKWVGLWAHPNKKPASAFWLEQILAFSLTLWGILIPFAAFWGSWTHLLRAGHHQWHRGIAGPSESPRCRRNSSSPGDSRDRFVHSQLCK